MRWPFYRRHEGTHHRSWAVGLQWPGHRSGRAYGLHVSVWRVGATDVDPARVSVYWMRPRRVVLVRVRGWRCITQLLIGLRPWRWEFDRGEPSRG